MTVRILDVMLIQKAVYWGAPVSNGRGGYTFATDVEISVRWEDKQELFVDLKGLEKLSRAVVYVDRDIVPGGFLYLGKEETLPVEHTDPQILPNCFMVKAYSKIPTLRGLQFLRMGWL